MAKEKLLTSPLAQPKCQNFYLCIRNITIFGAKFNTAHRICHYLITRNLLYVVMTP